MLSLSVFRPDLNIAAERIFADMTFIRPKAGLTFINIAFRKRINIILLNPPPLLIS